jgi:hypothetical protein
MRTEESWDLLVVSSDREGGESSKAEEPSFGSAADEGGD